MICPNCHKEVEGRWVNDSVCNHRYFACENCESELETENTYEDYVCDMLEEIGLGRNRDE